MNVKDIPISDLVESSHNPRHHPEHQLDTLIQSIKTFGFNSPVLVTEQNEIIAGHGRVRAAKRLRMKAVYLVMRMLMNSSQRNGRVLDPCAGSGTTLIACEKLQRKACLIELDPRYCDVIIQRWQAFTGQKAVHGQSGEPFEQDLL